MYQHILAPIDGSETSNRALGVALQIAQENGAELVPLYVIDIPVMGYEAPGFDPSIVRDALLAEGERLKADALEVMQRANVKGTPRLAEVNVVGGDIAQCILEEASAIDAELVVMGTHGRRGFRRLMLGSVAERFLRMARCPVLLIPASAGSSTPAESATKPS